MKKVLSVLFAVLMMSVAFAQMPTRIANFAAQQREALQVSNPRHAAGMPAAKETYNYTSVVYTAKAYNDEGYNVQDPETNVESVYDWQVTLKTADGDKFLFDILGSTIVSGQTYTLADMDADYTWAQLAGEETGWSFAAASFTYTNNNGDVTIVAQVTDSAGNIFNINYAPVTFDDATDTIEVVIPHAALGDYTADQGAIQMYGFTADSVYYVTVAAQATQVEGNYVFANFITNYTYVYRYYDEQEIVLVDGHATVSTTSDGYMMDAYLLGGDNHVYHVTMTYALPSLANALDTTEVVIVNPTFTDYTSEDYSYYFMGYTVDSAYFAQINYYSHNLSVTGYFPFDSLYVQYCNVAINDEYTTSIDGHVTVTENNGAYDVDAYLMDEDYHAYHVTMHYVIPVAEDTIDVMVSQAAMEQIPGGWFSSASVTWTGTSDDETYDVNVSYYSSDVDGVFPFVNMTSDTKINNVTFVSGHVTVSATNDGHQLEAYLLGNDSHCYHINMTYTVPTMEDATDTIEFTVANAELVDALASDGLFQFYGDDETEYYHCYLTANASQIEGSYEFADFNTDYTSVYEDETRVSIVEGHFTVTATATGYTVDAYLLGANLHCYHVTMIYTSEGISTVNNVTVNVYPNPATDVLHVEANGINRIDVIDLAGRIVLSSTQAQNTINISSLANGIYMLRTSTMEGVNVQKIVKK